MKKILSVLLAVVMIFTCFSTVLVFAEDEETAPVCTCANHNPNGPCSCCVYCPNLDKGKLTSCVEYNENGVASFCCDQCTGIWPCNCGHECCNDHYADIDDGSGLPLLNDDQQQAVITGFRAVLAKISAVFDMLLDAVIKFLRIEDVFPDLLNR